MTPVWTLKASQELPVVLRRFNGTLESLAEISVYTTCFFDTTIYAYHSPQDNQYDEEIWNYVDGLHDGQWGAFIRNMSEILSGWCVQKSITVDPSIWRAGAMALKEIQINFGKPQTIEETGAVKLKTHKYVR